MVLNFFTNLVTIAYRLKLSLHILCREKNINHHRRNLTWQ
ncbi:hypothetical protein RUMHYD_03912 [Blautia hydrogenotrophica DSM 10507]|uniref:Uncharacterized protein n=1 Tax=Blautia hydrogenotrophica (strain DSM 10507 / JCM 14656 / S5a33) TaxID=476272 RepID=C0CSP3_BLAHS|nr:hypothetical protein RUMHYD_03912 [Blautia hydrogenotrophica DSM 10507]